MQPLDWFAVGVALVASLAGAVSDVWLFRVSNWLTLPLFVAGVVYHAFQGWASFGDGLLGGLFGLAVLLGPYALGLMGAGDVKLLAAVGAWLGLWGVMGVFAVSSLVAGVYAVAQIIARGKTRESWITLRVIFRQFATAGMSSENRDLVGELVNQPDRRLRVIPYGVSIPFGVIGFVLFHLWWFGVSA